MSPKLKAAFALELEQARTVEASGDHPRAWRHLERAHILSQPFGVAHVVVHGRMLGFALRQRDIREAWGQLVRVLVAAPGSWLGRAPVGNTGGADVGILTPMPIPPELQELLRD
jgi:ferric-dicitrate binding protein FerR (iron transport regulator)